MAIEPKLRMTDSAHPPSYTEVSAWIGRSAYRYWTQITGLIEKNYPDVFTPEWLFGGKKHGWSLRYKKNKSFCTLIPEKNRLALLIVFGAEERAKVENIRDGLSRRIQKEYDDAPTYHDGKWLLIAVNGEPVVQEIMRLLAVKRKPKSGSGATPGKVSHQE